MSKRITWVQASAVLVGLVALLTLLIWNFVRSYEVDRLRTIESREREKLGAMVSISRSYVQRIDVALDIIAVELESAVTLAEQSSSLPLVIGQELERWLVPMLFFNQLSVWTDDGQLLAQSSRSVRGKISRDPLLAPTGRYEIELARALSSPEKRFSPFFLADTVEGLSPSVPIALVSRSLPLPSGGKGMLVASFDTRFVIDEIAGATSNPPLSYGYIVRPDGVLVLGDESLGMFEYADQRDLPNGRFPEIYPTLWQVIIDQASGSLQTEDGLFIFESVPHNPDVTRLVGADKLKAPVAVIHLPTQSIQATSLLRRSGFYVFLGMLYLTVIGLAWTLIWSLRGREALKVSETKYRTTLHNLQQMAHHGRIGLQVLNPTTGEMQIDEVTRELFDMPADTYPDHVLERCVNERIDPEFRPVFQETVAKALETGANQAIVYSITLPDGRKRWIKGNVELGHSESGSPLLQGAATDVTQLVETQERLQRQQDDQNRIFGIIAHELRTPAAAIQMFADELSISDKEKVDLQELTRQLLNAIDDLRVAINPSEFIELHPARITLEALMEQLSRYVRPMFTNHPLALETQLAGELGTTYMVDGYRIRTIITNLIKNAILHSQGSRIHVLLESEPVDNLLHRLTVVVEDNGVGIDDSLRDQMFEPFLRGNTQARGTGVGLYIVKSWVELMGGTVNFEPVATGGARFVVSLPLPLAREESGFGSSAIDKVSLAKAILSDKQILFVEDEAILRRLACNVIKNQFGVGLYQAADGAEALELLQATDCDLIITDYFMPNLDGLQLIKALREQGIQTPIIGLTAATIGDERQSLIAAGAQGALAKPLNVAEFAALVIEIFQPSATDDANGINER